MHNPSFAEFANLCGGTGFRVTDQGDLDQAIADALAVEGPSLVEIITDPELYLAGGARLLIPISFARLTRQSRSVRGTSFFLGLCARPERRRGFQPFANVAEQQFNKGGGLILAPAALAAACALLAFLFSTARLAPAPEEGGDFGGQGQINSQHGLAAIHRRWLRALAHIE